jgi:Flp pilus assembly protein TadD
MSWKTILKRQTTQSAIDNIGKQRDILKELDEMVRKFHGEEMISGEEFKDLAVEYQRAHKTTMDSIKRILGRLARA